VSADALEARRRRSERAFYQLFDGVDLGDGVWAAVTETLPDRSFPNAAIYEDGRALVARIDDLASLYASRGVRAWTVWVLPDDRFVADALRDAGHVLDATPRAMGARLDALALEGEDLGEPVSWDDVIAVNEAAYRFGPGQMSIPELQGMRFVGVPGKACVGTLDVEGDAWVGMVATHPSAQRQRLCERLLRQALRAARGRGCTTTTLEATKAGEPVYARVGYRPLGTLEMWERRVVAPS
jgi:ribosomal protein S18 acetylase RimI-like enzyme